MVEHVVGLKPQLNVSFVVLHERKVLEDLEIGVVIARAVEKIAPDVSEGTNGFRRKTRRVEILMSGRTRI